MLLSFSCFASFSDFASCPTLIANPDRLSDFASCAHTVCGEDRLSDHSRLNHDFVACGRGRATNYLIGASSLPRLAERIVLQGMEVQVETEPGEPSPHELEKILSRRSRSSASAPETPCSTFGSFEIPCEAVKVLAKGFSK